jgi:hypothetical protein
LKTKRSIAKIRRYATKLCNEVETLLVDRVFYVAGQPFWSSRARPKRGDFDKLFSALSDLQSAMETAQSRTTMQPGRKSVQPIDNLLKFLNWIQAEASDDNVQRSAKDSDRSNSTRFVHLCCKKVGLTKGQVERALRRNISEFHAAIMHDNFDLSVGKAINKKYRPKSRRSRRIPGRYV